MIEITVWHLSYSSLLPRNDVFALSHIEGAPRIKSYCQSQMSPQNAALCGVAWHLSHPRVCRSHKAVSGARLSRWIGSSGRHLMPRMAFLEAKHMEGNHRLTRYFRETFFRVIFIQCDHSHPSYCHFLSNNIALKSIPGGLRQWRKPLIGLVF